MTQTKDRSELLVADLKRQVVATRKDLLAAIMWLAADLKGAAASVEAGDLPNTAGVVQAQGSRIDMLVARLESEVRAVERAEAMLR